LDIVFVSCDRDQSAFDEYFKEMPWKALPFPGMF
jgi:nucleoredoxin